MRNPKFYQIVDVGYDDTIADFCGYFQDTIADFCGYFQQI
jgi:hypothetical protein